MIAFATAEMAEDLKGIWKECFHDEDSYISFYFDNRFEPENTLVWLEEGRPQAMLTLLPAAVSIADGVKPVRYVYAVATKEAMRGRGIAGALLDYAAEYTKAQDTGLILVPASRTLFDYYAKQGYEASVEMRTMEWTIDEVRKMAAESGTTKENKTIEPDRVTEEDKTTEPIRIMEKAISEEEYRETIEEGKKMLLHKEDAKIYKDIRDKAFLGQEGYVIWTEDAIAYAIAENEFCGGFTYLIETLGEKQLIMGYELDETLVLKETTIQQENLYSILETIMVERKCNKCKVRGLTDNAIFGKKIGFAMTKNLAHFHKGYFNLCLD